MCFIVESTIEKSMKKFYVRPVKIISNYPTQKQNFFVLVKHTFGYSFFWLKVD